jgi:hypothetical protein
MTSMLESSTASHKVDELDCRKACRTCKGTHIQIMLGSNRDGSTAAPGFMGDLVLLYRSKLTWPQK